MRGARTGGWIALAAACAGCVTEPPLKPVHDMRAQAWTDGWEVSTPAAEGFDAGALAAAYARFHADSAHRNGLSLLVVRHGKLVAESYVRGAQERAVARNIQSATKSVTSLVFGIAQARSSRLGLDSTLYGIYPERFGADPRTRSITLRHLLTMRSGIDFGNDDFSLEMLVGRPDDPVRHILSRPLYADPGERFRYRDADPQLLSYAVQRATGSTLRQVAEEELFRPLGIHDWFWEADPQGTTLGPFALYLRPRDMARLGELALRGGRWQGRQVVPEAWIRLSTAAQVDPARGGLGYGFYWWVVPELDAFAASGHGGNFILVAPARDVVVVMTSLPHASDEVGTTLQEFVPLARAVLAAAR